MTNIKKMLTKVVLFSHKTAINQDKPFINGNLIMFDLMCNVWLILPVANKA